MLFDVSVENGNRVNVDWATSSENNNDYFIIDRSKDMLNWDEVARVNGAGNSNEILFYSLKDVVPTPGLYYYQLRQVDFNGDSETFDVKSVLIEGNKGNIEFSFYPNPASYVITIALNGFTDSDFQIEISNISGQVVYTKTINQTDELQQQLDVSALMSGIYIVKVYGNDFQQSSKLIIGR
jgi:hypothetical protein